jgi:hypothetical protein
MKSHKPTASLSLDLDNRWSYLKTHGDAAWEAYPSYLPVLIPIVLDLLARHDLKCTFFVVGQDAARPENAEALRAIAAAGHEFGNHSFEHEPWMQDYEEARVRAELEHAHATIHDVTGLHPVGFRGPGFCYSAALLETIKGLGYTFDASMLPSFIGPLARLYYIGRTTLSREQRQTRRNLFGRFGDGFAPLRPFTWRTSRGALLEIPVTTMPVFRLPFHLSYIIWLSRFSVPLAKVYFRIALLLCRIHRVEPSFLLHPLDFLGKEDAPDLHFFPGMDLPREKKLKLVDWVFTRLCDQFDVVPMAEHARRVQGRQVREREMPALELP